MPLGCWFGDGSGEKDRMQLIKGDMEGFLLLKIGWDKAGSRRHGDMEATPGTVPAFQFLFFIGTQSPSPGHLESLKPTALGRELLEESSP